MDRRERFESAGTAMLAMLEGFQAGLWTAMPGIIQSYDATKQTCSVQVAIKARALDKTGAETWMAISVLVDCPVVFPGGGGLTLTFPLAAGDECLVVFASRCIDYWWLSGGVQEQAELRMHDLSDGFVLPGVRSQPRKLAGVSTNSVQLRNDAGDAYVELKQDKSMVLAAPSGLTINGATVINGQTTINGNVASTGTLSNNGKAVGSTHTHSGVQAGPSSTGVPN
jgi:hypothetical protein